MQDWINFAQGPLFRLTFTIMILGLLIEFIRVIYGFGTTLTRTQDRTLNTRKIFRDTLSWLIPISRLKGRAIFTMLSIILHIGMIITPIFLWGHIELIRNSTGISWPALNKVTADWITLITFNTAFIIFVIRLFSRQSRALSRFQDYFLIFLIGFVFFTGYFTAHPEHNPVPYQTTIFIHIVSGCLTFLLVPFSKLTHILFVPFTQFATELAWHFPPESGEMVHRALGKDEGEL